MPQRFNHNLVDTFMQKRLTIPELRKQKGKMPLVCLTAYSAPVAALLDPHVDVLLVGDSVGMVLYGMDSTLGVTLEMMIAHGQAVVRASKRACVVVDMPFGTYQASPTQAFGNAAKLLAETGCQAVKLEGGVEMAETVTFLTARGIPVVGHVGLMPQHVNMMGGYVYQGRTKSEIATVVEQAQAIYEAGASAIVLEGISVEAARQITAKIAIPTIGIGAAPECDGQVLVTEDMAGLFAETPRFVKQYGNLAGELTKAAAQYAEDVRKRRFPGDEHGYNGR